MIVYIRVAVRPGTAVLDACIDVRALAERLRGSILFEFCGISAVMHAASSPHDIARKIRQELERCGQGEPFVQWVHGPAESRPIGTTEDEWPTSRPSPTPAPRESGILMFGNQSVPSWIGNKSVPPWIVPVLVAAWRQDYDAALAEVQNAITFQGEQCVLREVVRHLPQSAFPSEVKS